MCLSLPAWAEGRWITDAEALTADAASTPIALQFRREVALTQKPGSFRVRVSADQRFVLFVNGRRAGAGPARGHLKQWRYETIDIAPLLDNGTNVVAARVWNDAKSAPLAQMTSGHTAFWLQAENSDHSRLVDTGGEWQVRVDRSRSVEPGMPQLSKALGSVFYAAGPPETFDAALQADDWAERATHSQGWRAAVPANESLWTLIPDPLPQMRFERVSSGRVVRAQGVSANDFPGKVITVPAHTDAAIVVDAGRVLSAYPSLVLSGGAGARVDITYVEALYDPDAKPADTYRSKRVRFGDRSTVGNGLALGLTDTFKPDGAVRRFQPFWWRTWRFVEIRIKTESQPLTLKDFETWETGYPFAARGRFVSSDPELNALWNIGWRTALVDAHETYMDSSYWEQLQYIGDTRIQMLLSYNVAGDARLAIQALDAFDQSRVVEGLPQSAWPGVLRQVIPPFALLWIGSLHDYWMLQPDTSVVKRTLPGTRAVLDEFARYVEPSGLVGPMPGWPFVDWKPGLDGWAERGKGIRSCIISMQYIGALREAADLERAIGDRTRADTYIASAKKSVDGVNAQCWDERRGLYADSPEKARFSQHANVLAVLHDIAPASEHRALLDRVTILGRGIDPPEGITGTSYYFSFYLARALAHAGLGDRYVELLQSWRALLQRNFTTWPETPDPSRSDTHAWSAHPTSGLLEYVAGIKSAAPGFTRVRIEPQLGSLMSLDAAVTHPQGLIEAQYTLREGKLSAVITLPAGLSGDFNWHGQRRGVVAGKNEFTLSEPAG
jgi:hypothetical protein